MPLQHPPFPVPPEVTRIARRLARAGFQAFVAGGAVRDLVMGRQVADWDLATDARPEQVSQVFGRVVPTGLRHGTVTLVRGGRPYELTTFRTRWSGRFSRRLETDLAHRDFTLNAMAYDPLAGALIDPGGGREDIRRRRVRAMGDPAARFAEDPLRILRAVRLATVLGFRLEEETWARIPSHLGPFRRVAAERVREELMKILLAPRPSAGLELMRRSGLLQAVLPELLEGYRMKQNSFHRYTVYRHILQVVDAAPPDPALRLAALLHDIAKPRVRSKARGTFHFYNHEAEGARMARAILRRLRFSRALEERVCHLVLQHMFYYQEGWSDAAVRRLVRRAGREQLGDLFALRRADLQARGTGDEVARLELQRLEELRSRIEVLERSRPPLSVRDLKLGGREVMRALGIAEGPEVGRALEALLQEVLDDPARNRRAWLLGRLRQWRREGRGVTGGGE